MMDFVTLLLNKPVYCLPLTIGIYFLSLLLYRKVRIGLFHPLIVTISLLILMLYLSDTSYEAVSYTHLDVYKRQELCRAKELLE